MVNSHKQRIETERLVIMSRTIEEMEAVYQHEEDPDMKQAYYEMYCEMKRIAPHVEWACDWQICLKSGEVVGGIGYKGLPNDRGYVEVGYGIDPAFQHKGIATEAVSGMVKWAFEHSEVQCVQGQTDPGNEISKKVLANNGFIRNGDGPEGPMFEKYRD